ncbi:MAG: hypothetical protein LBV42_00510 [Methanobrevibacter sp.]|nr:hypothetical protein [Methanobrevibacter sp.]
MDISGLIKVSNALRDNIDVYHEYKLINDKLSNFLRARGIKNFEIAYKL